MVRLLIAAALIVIPTGTTQVAQNEKPTRELTRDTTPILSRISPGDRFVTVRWPGSLEDPTPSDSAEIELINLAQIEELFVLRQLRLEPYFVGNGNWIRTRVSGTVSQVLNTHSLAATPDSKVEFEFDGGEMVVNGVRILAGYPPELDRPTYLIGLQFHPVAKQWQLIKLFEVSPQETLATRRRRDNGRVPESKLHGKSLDEVATEVAKRQK